MKRLYKVLGTATFGLAVILPLVGNMSATAEIANPVQLIAQAAQPQIILNLSVAKKAITATVQGNEQVEWEQLEDGVAVAPGDELRYTIVGQNTGDAPAKNLEVTQPIPELMTYKLDSATSEEEVQITYSTDEGETFVAEPKIEVKLDDGTVEERPAPAEAYTHIRWNFTTVTPETGATAMYNVQVQ
ncbi:MAG: hypothetical protein AAFO95_06915 [Cyanobacteria bacterium J06600_6]